MESLSRCNFNRGRLLGRVASLGMEHSLEAQAEVLAAEALETSAIERDAESQIFIFDSNTTSKDDIAANFNRPKNSAGGSANINWGQIFA